MERSPTQIVEFEGAQLHYEICGEGGPVVLLHAGIADRRMWHPQISALSRRHRVVSYDLRGFGETGMATGIHCHAHDLGALLDGIGLGEVSLIGASMGGAVAIDFALESPERVERMILAAPAVAGYEFHDEPSLKLNAAAEQAFEEGDHARAAELESELWVAGPGRGLEDVDTKVTALVREMLLGVYSLDSDDAEEKHVSPLALSRLEAIATPTLVVLGEHDVPDMHEIARLLEARLPRVTMVAVPDAAHLVNLERPDVFNDLVLRFLAESTP